MKIYEDLESLIIEMESQDNHYALSDDTIRESGNLDREERGIEETSYGIVTVPVDWVLPYLKELQELRRRNEASRN